jgi:hypothetical protein
VNEEKVAALASDERTELGERERLAVELLDRYALGYGGLDERLSEVFTEREIAELIRFTAWFASIHKLMNVYDVPPPELDELDTWTTSTAGSSR